MTDAQTMLRELLDATKHMPVDMFLRQRCEAALPQAVPAQPQREPAPWFDRTEHIRDVLELITELLVDTWSTAMDSDPEREIGVVEARAILSGKPRPQCARDAVIEECARHLEACGFRYSQGFDVPQSLRRLKGAALSGKPSAAGREAIAKTIAAWIGTSWDALPGHNTVERGFPEWTRAYYNGGKPDLLRLADALMAHTRQEPGAEKGGRLTFCERCNANRVHVRTKIIDGVQMFECPVCAVARPERCTPNAGCSSVVEQSIPSGSCVGGSNPPAGATLTSQPRPESETPPAFSEENLAHCLSYHNETVRDWDICRAVDAYRAPRNKGDTRTLADFLETAGLRISAVTSHVRTPQETKDAG